MVDSPDYDAIFFTGGHAVMHDFPGSEGLQRVTREIFEHGGIVASVCHGYCGLLETKLSNGSYLIAGRELTGFAWFEEKLARVDKLVPYNEEERAKERGAHCTKRPRCRLFPTQSSTETSWAARTRDLQKKQQKKGLRTSCCRLRVSDVQVEKVSRHHGSAVEGNVSAVRQAP